MRYLGFFPLFFFFLFAGLGGSPINQKIKKHGISGEYAEARKRMVQEQILGSGVRDERVLRAMSKVPRHLFVPPAYRYLAYADGPLPIGMGQTISQPYIVAFMTEALKLSPEDRVLEVGTGSGYQAAVLAELVKEVFTIEIIPDLGLEAEKRLNEMGYKNIHVRIGDGYLGWPDKAPFDAIMVTAAADEVPQPLIEQLKGGGRLCIPVESEDFVQYLIRITKTPTGTERETLLPVRFVPLVHPGKKVP